MAGLSSWFRTAFAVAQNLPVLAQKLPTTSTHCFLRSTKCCVLIDGTARAFKTMALGEVMLKIHMENTGDIRILECAGRIVRSEAAFTLREAVTSQRDARTIVLDLSEVRAIEGGGLGMLWFLQRWAYERGIRLKLFNPINSVRDRLRCAHPTPPFNIVTREEMMALRALSDSPSALAA
jgi:anti-anti-sigma regulatory factor